MMRLFETEKLAKVYAQVRPEPPLSLINCVVQYVKEEVPVDRAVDVGCGSGQNTRRLAPHFKSVLATDISPAQISEAKASNNLDSVEYKVSPAEEIPLPDRSVQLVTACECCHFFDLPRFFTEADRVLVPGGVLAIYGYPRWRLYKDGQLWKEIDDVLQEVMEATLDRFLPGIKAELEGKYTDPKYRLPYKGEIRDESHYDEEDVPVDKILAAITSMSAFHMLVKEDGREAGEAVLKRAKDRFIYVLSKDGSEIDTSTTLVTRRNSFFLVMARKPVQA